MPMREVWVAIHDAVARLRMVEAAAAVGHAAVPIDAHSRTVPAPACAAVVSDLTPFADSLDLLEHVRRHRQGMPIMLYLAVRTDADVALSRAIALGVEEVVFARGKPNERERLAEMLGRVLAQGAAGNLLDRIAVTVPRASSRGFKVLKHYGIQLAKDLGQADHVETVSAALGLTPRTLQRALRQDGWPGPKELLDWMLLLTVAMGGAWPAEKNARRRAQRAVRRMPEGEDRGRPPDVDAVLEAFVDRVATLG